ncbi:MAG: hypothetical protein LKJ72_04070 [[Lactobacillus] timonensis]|jgi:competence CoiA-like predicted nuclease|uniref:competence protein CoiA family protein n=1 Tax=[Lactobacillus] timonensis TaxID=1970790 RepID=UPI0011AEE549|nr:competence protein CoiA family protein [[Lactobacillus] timonensis]MCI1287500.1 hypothetical protein [[Lactobacillus] timonensis]MCI1926180.1 hypothetical protein [[Lactobacillus] timonensis]MCI1957540.1 hypothetical protein [[Lactobacillus] timonensis]MCI1970550.1 hypothetical protein [[Lactobacillus] timonensis]MCI2006734.1 hypothetical protein [[Lactobacillus] timonensis]
MKVALLHERPVRAELCFKSADYRCTDCGQQMILCRGTKKVAYFAHHRRDDCGSSDGETP